MGVTQRHARRMLRRMRSEGNRAVVHGLRGRPSNRRISAETRDRIVTILSQEVCRDFGRTLASKPLRSNYGIEIGREALRRVMTAAGLRFAECEQPTPTKPAPLRRSHAARIAKSASGPDR